MRMLWQQEACAFRAPGQESRLQQKHVSSCRVRMAAAARGEFIFRNEDVWFFPRLAGGTGLQPMLAAADAALADQLARQAACLASLRTHVLHTAAAEAPGRVRPAAVAAVYRQNSCSLLAGCPTTNLGLRTHRRPVAAGTSTEGDTERKGMPLYAAAAARRAQHCVRTLTLLPASGQQPAAHLPIDVSSAAGLAGVWRWRGSGGGGVPAAQRGRCRGAAAAVRGRCPVWRSAA